MDGSNLLKWNWYRILIGEVPLGFLLEAIIRVGFIYVLLVLAMRVLGKKMASQFTLNEMAALVSLAAAVGVPILSPDRGLLPALMISIVIIAMSRILIYFASKTQRFESLVSGNIKTLINDGVLDVHVMENTGITRERIFAELRSKNIINLAEVKKLFFEASGHFTLIKDGDAKPGLSVLPEADEAYNNELPHSDHLVCTFCGQRNPGKNNRAACSSCGHTNWTQGISIEEKKPEEVHASQH
jgi:uncharacterized membrane protein YcaP (DUF421 family)